MNIETIIALCWAHFVADFVAQTEWMAHNKSKNFTALWLHIVVYQVFFFPFGWRFALLNGSLHLIVDFFTSRFNAAMWESKRYKFFWMGIGFDQAVHMTCLIFTANHYLK